MTGTNSLFFLAQQQLDGGYGNFLHIHDAGCIFPSPSNKYQNSHILFQLGSSLFTVEAEAIEVFRVPWRIPRWWGIRRKPTKRKRAPWSNQTTTKLGKPRKLMEKLTFRSLRCILIATSPFHWHGGVFACRSMWREQEKMNTKLCMYTCCMYILCCYYSLIDFVAHFSSLNLLLRWTTTNHPLKYQHYQAALQWVAQVEYALGFSLIAIALFSGRNAAGRVGFRWCNPKDQWIRWTPKKHVMNCIEGIHGKIVKSWSSFFFHLESELCWIMIKLPSRRMYFNLCGNWQLVAC